MGALGAGAALALSAPALPAPQLGVQAVTRLWIVERDGAVPACTAVYVRDPLGRLPGGAAWILTAAHCTADRRAYTGRDGPGQRFSAIDWRKLVDPALGLHGRVPDLAVATGRPPAAGSGSVLDLGERMGREGTIWLHGFPFGVEHLTAGRIVGESADRPGSVEVQVVVGPVTEAGPGFSGAPLIDHRGRVVGVLWGLRADDPSTLRMFVTPVEAIRELLGHLPVHKTPRRE